VAILFALPAQQPVVLRPPYDALSEATQPERLRVLSHLRIRILAREARLAPEGLSSPARPDLSGEPGVPPIG